MTTESEAVSASAERDQRKKIHFDGTINAGHVFTFITLILAGLGAWFALDKRVAVLEEARSYQVERDKTQDAALKDSVDRITSSVSEMSHKLDRLIERQSK